MFQFLEAAKVAGTTTDHTDHTDWTRSCSTRKETFRIRGAVFEVHNTVGSGFLEAVYQECLAIEFSERRIPFAALRPIPIEYKGHWLKQNYVPDFICFDRIIVELKAVREFAPEHRAQIINYLRATGMRVGLLVNFGAAQDARLSASRSEIPSV